MLHTTDQKNCEYIEQWISDIENYEQITTAS